MSILINMEMPIGCYCCPIAHRNYRLEAEETQLACYAKGEWVSDDGERPDWCPLIELPPHGRLIDEDKLGLTDFEIVMCDGSYKKGLEMLAKKIEDAPTVIPADKDINVPTKNNADRIRAMTDNELAKFLIDVQTDCASYCSGETVNQYYPFPEGWNDWLKEEVKQGN